MTRLNLIPPSELMDQHLFAEWREIKMVPKSLARSIVARGINGVPKMIPKEFTLNTGHVSFFYDKGLYLFKRYGDLTRELHDRGVNFDKSAKLDPSEVFMAVPGDFLKDYTPTEAAMAIIRERIAQRIAERPNWYRMRGVIQ